MKLLDKHVLMILLCAFCIGAQAQTTIKGEVLDAANNDPLIGATVIVKGTTTGLTTDWDGTFSLTVDQAYPIELEISYVGYATKNITVVDNKRLSLSLDEDAVIIEGVEVKASRISDKQKESPLTIEAMDLIAIKETPAADFYDGLGSLKGVDLTAASLGFKVVNTRGFNSTSPVRSLQIIDGVDNQAPGLNFSLGNFLGTSELDVNKVELIVGASSAFYGPNAFNGVISMETKDPFFHSGLSAMLKVGERNMAKTAVRWSDVINNKNEQKFFAYKFNLEYLRADDWVADNYDAVDGTDAGVDNPGGYDAVNIYGDEYQGRNDVTSADVTQFPGLLSWNRTGYKEEDLVDYDTRNLKANLGVYFRTNPAKEEQSPILSVKTNFGAGTTVYQGDNRFSLKNISFFQNIVEFKKRNKYFIRAYNTRTTAGDSYDPYFTALALQDSAKSNARWSDEYLNYWLDNVRQVVNADETFPQKEIVLDENGVPIIDPITGEIQVTFDQMAYEQWLIDNNQALVNWHNDAEAFANATNDFTSQDFFVPGTARFDQKFQEITSKLRSEGGTRFFDNSALYHVHGEYVFTPTWMDRITVGANARIYAPRSKGTVFRDTAGIKITNREVGLYAGIEKSFMDNKIKVTLANRLDKNENFNLVYSPAGSIVYTPSKNNFFRASFSSAIRNPTLADQYLSLNVGRAILAGNLEGVENLVTVPSLINFFDTQKTDTLEYFNIDAVKPEEVKTFEFGYRSTLFNNLYVDAGYYYSIYDNFLGFNIGVDFEFNAATGTPTKIQPYRYSANSKNRVTTQGLAIGLNYFLPKNLSVSGNYSFNQLLKSNDDDPIIPAFNTPTHKFNVGFSGRNMTIPLGSKKIKNIGFSINYKWIEGFIFEGSPQFSGFIPTYDLLDAQVNFQLTKINTNVKIGASNILNKASFQTYGGPRIGRLAYISLTYEGKK